MNENEQMTRIHEQFRNIQKTHIGWRTSERGFGAPKKWLSPFKTVIDCGADSLQITRGAQVTFDANWANDVPELITRMVTLLQEKKTREIEFNLVRFAINSIERRMQRLESLQTKIIPIDTFAPEPYNLLKTIHVSVTVAEDEFEAGWYDANIHLSGDNEQEAVSNLKGFILDLFDSYSSKPPEKLGPEPTRQLAVMKEYIHKKL